MVVCRTNPSIFLLARKKCLATPYDENAANKVLIFFSLREEETKTTIYDVLNKQSKLEIY